VSTASLTAQERYFVATQWQLMWRKLLRHKLALVGGAILALLYCVAVFCEFFAVSDIHTRRTDYILCRPQAIRFFHEGRPHLPFVYGLKQESDPVTWRRIYVDDKTQVNPVRFFAKGDPYRLWGLFPADRHLLGVDTGTLFILGTDESGRDMYSRMVYGGRVSLSVGLIGVFLSFILGCVLGGVSGYYGGSIDVVIQRVIEFLISIPTIPLWMALGAAMPKDWSSLRIYFAITIILSVVGWCGLARVVRGKLLELREEDFVLAARLAGAPDRAIIARHLLPGFLSYLIVNITLAIPGMILGETALSFLGIGIRPPVVSWGVLLKDAQNVKTVAQAPWLLTPALLVISTVLSFNFLGDGLRDAADPYR
jgi:peptide/nickel transport system permease protein